MSSVCSICNGKYNVRLATSEPPVCMSCYQKQNIKIGYCSECKENEAYDIQVNKKEQRPICRKCRCKLYKRKEEICIVCDKLKGVKFRSENGPVCDGCYKNNFQPKEICISCGKFKVISQRNENNDPICKSCYKTPKDICSICNKEKPVNIRNDEVIVCKNCYNIWKKENDPNFVIIRRIRDRLRDALKLYAKSKKIKSADEYGVDYKKIIEYLGPCPGERKDYHIDHIKPLSLFDFSDLEQIKLAFAPENHQWLKSEENLKKGDKYDGE